MSDQYTVAGWKIGLEFEEMFNRPLSLFVPSQLAILILTVIGRKSSASKLKTSLYVIVALTDFVLPKNGVVRDGPSPSP